jgi:uncharacterized protein (TIGR02145 family)
MKKTYTILAVLGIFALLLTCEKFEVSPLTKLKTISATPELRTITARGKILELSKKDHSEYGFAYGPMQYPLVADGNVILDDAVVGEYTAVIEGLDMGQQYYIRAFCLDGDKYVYGEPVAATTFAVTVTTVNPTEIISTAATSGGSISVNGTVTISARGVCWKTTANPTVLDSRTTDGNGNGSFTSRLTGLTANTAYYVRAYAITPTDTIYGNEINFSTNNLTTPSVTNGTISQITPTSATCTAEVTSNGGLTVTERGVCWKTTANPTVDDTHATNGEGTGIFSVNITGLTPNTTYYYRVYAINSVSITYGQEQTFKTAVALPTVQTTSITNIGVTTATGGGNVTGDGNGTISAKGICWDSNPEPTITKEKTMDGNGLGAFVSNLTGLNENKTYYVRAYATNEAGTAYGNQVSFTTLHQVELPTVTTAAVSSISYTTATCGGNVTNDGYGVVTARGLCWSKTHNPPTTSDSKTDNGSGTGSFVGELTDLTPNTKYYVRAYAINSAGTGYGNTFEFSTLAMAVPTLSTTAISAITATTATCGGSITSNGGSAVTVSGICWSTATNPTTTLGTKTTNGTLTGSFTGSMTNLLPATTYYVRAYATNGVGTGYGNELSFTTLSINFPTITTGSVTEVTTSSAKVNGEVTNEGNGTVSERGICWGTSANPTIAGSHNASGTGLGTFTVDITGLTGNTTYHVRAYATNEAGTAYGSDVSFTTPITVSDVDGNTYKAVTIGTQVWMAENLKTTRLNDGSAIPLVTLASEWKNLSTPAYCWYDNTIGYKDYFGGLYNWYVVETGKLCPSGWHVPSDWEWKELEMFLGMTLAEADQTGWRGSGIGTMLKSTSGWSTNGTNTSGFTGLPGGDRSGADGAFNYVNEYGYWWSTSAGSLTNYSMMRDLGNVSTVGRYSFSNKMGLSVRCLKGSVETVPIVSTNSISSITANSSVCGGNVSADGGASVTARGVCWSTSPNPTVDLTTKTTDGAGTGSFTSSITGLTPGTKYYVRAYATNSVGTAYGEEVNFTTAVTAIGATYAGGIVFYLDETGQHGLVCAPSDQSTGAPWGCQGTNLPGADGTAVGTGAQNTIDIENGCTTAGTAADICANLSLNGYTDWFFPSKDELNLMYTNLKLNGIGNFTESWYSSSSEYSANNVWEQNFSTGTQTTMYGQLNNKGLTRFVRAARAF